MHFKNCNNFESKNKNRSRKFSIIAEKNQNSHIYQQAKKVAAFDNLTILITGETGTGKEVLFHYIKQNSQRADKPFKIANLSAIPENLIKGELFGYKKGSFTGATNDYDGLIKGVNGGIIFLDEIGDIPYDVQTALLRFLDYGEIITLGKGKAETVDVRVIAATNVNLLNKIETGGFREDLYYRLCGFPLHLTPLREKPKQELKSTIDFLITDTAKSMCKDEIQLTERALDFLLNYNYKGNYREARNIIERFYVVEKSILDIDDILPLITHKDNEQKPQTSDDLTAESKSSLIKTEISIDDFTIDELVALKVGVTFAKNDDVKSHTARELGIDYKTLNKHLDTFKSIGNIPKVIGINPIPDLKNSKTNFQK